MNKLFHVPRRLDVPMGCPRFFLSAVACLCWLIPAATALSGTVQDRENAHAPMAIPSDEPPSTMISLWSGQQISGSVEKIDDQGRVTGSGLPEKLTIDQINAIDFQRPVAQSEKSSVRVFLSGNGVLNGQSLTIDQGRVRLDAGSSSWDVPLEAVVGMVWGESSMLESLLRDRSSDRDRVLVKTDNGDRVVEGVLEKINATHLVLNYRGKSRRIAQGKIVAVVPADLKLASPGFPRATIVAVDASVLVGRLIELDGKTARLLIAGNRSIDIPTSMVSRIDIDAGRVVYLSESEPTDVVQSSAFAAPRLWQRNRSVEGNPLRLKQPDGRVVAYENGIGVSSYTRLTFSIPEGFDTFAATIGVDRETEGLGDCEMIVQADGIRIWAGRVRGVDPARELRLDVGGSSELTLIVDFGEDFDLADHADWCRARLIRTD